MVSRQTFALVSAISIDALMLSTATIVCCAFVDVNALCLVFVGCEANIVAYAFVAE